jgi:hypothetical protein
LVNPVSGVIVGVTVFPAAADADMAVPRMTEPDMRRIDATTMRTFALASRPPDITAAILDRPELITTHPPRHREDLDPFAASSRTTHVVSTKNM